MALDTKLNLSNQKFEQASGDTLNLSGTTTIFGNLQFSADKSENLTPRSIIDYGYYSGNTGVIKVSGDGIVNSLKSNIDIIGPGTVTLTNGSAIITGNATAFLDATTGIGVGYWYSLHIIDSSDRLYRVDLASIESNTGATINQVFSENQIQANGFTFNGSSTYTGTTGTYPYKIVTNYAKDIYSFSFGNKSYARNFSTAFGGSTVANGQTSFTTGLYTQASGNQSFAMGQYTLASGQKSFAGGWGSTQGTTIDKRVRAGGQTSFAFSENSTSQTVGHGALANQSAILGGRDHNIPSTSLRSAIIGGDTIKVAASVLNTVHMPKIRFGLGNNASISTDDSNNNLLVRDSSTGEIKIRSASSIGLNNFWKTTGTTTLSSATLVDTNNKTLIFDYGTAFETGSTSIVRATVGGTNDVTHLAFRHNSTRTLNDGFTDIRLGTNSGNASSPAGGNITIGQNILTSLVTSGTFTASPWFSTFRGDRNIGIGFDIATGWTSMGANQGTSNIMMGVRAGKTTQPFSYSFVAGFEASANITGDATTWESVLAIGTYALANAQFLSGATGSYGYLTAVGPYAGKDAVIRDGYGTVLIGNAAGMDAVMLEDYEILIGGAGQGASLGRGNIGIGERALWGSMGGSPGSIGTGTNQFNVAVGVHAMEGSGPSEKGTFVGCESGQGVVIGLKNTGYGSWSLPRINGNHNMGIGPYGGYMTSTITGNGNTFIGPSVGVSLSTLAFNNVMVIGNPSTISSTGGYRPVVESDTIYVGSVGDIVLTQDYNGSPKTVRFNPSGLTYGGDYSSGFTARSIPDVAYVTGLTSSLTSNTVNGVNVTTTYTATTNSDFVGVSGSTAFIVYLPSQPLEYQRITVADIKGNALSQNITINGGGKLINGSSTALIDSNYGSITMVYNTVNWSVIAFA